MRPWRLVPPTLLRHRPPLLWTCGGQVQRLIIVFAVGNRKCEEDEKCVRKPKNMREKKRACERKIKWRLFYHLIGGKVKKSLKCPAHISFWIHFVIYTNNNKNPWYLSVSPVLFLLVWSPVGSFCQFDKVRWKKKKKLLKGDGGKTNMADEDDAGASRINQSIDRSDRSQHTLFSPLRTDEGASAHPGPGPLIQIVIPGSTVVYCWRNVMSSKQPSCWFSVMKQVLNLCSIEKGLKSKQTGTDLMPDGNVWFFYLADLTAGVTFYLRH